MKRIEVVGTIEEGCRVPLDEPVPVAVDERARFIVLVGEDEPNAQVIQLAGEVRCFVPEARVITSAGADGVSNEDASALLQQFHRPPGITSG